MNVEYLDEKQKAAALSKAVANGIKELAEKIGKDLSLEPKWVMAEIIFQATQEYRSNPNQCFKDSVLGIIKGIIKEEVKKE
jgi:hypothetical protein